MDNRELAGQDVNPSKSGPRVSKPFPPLRKCKHKDCPMYDEEQKGDYESVYFAVLCGGCMRPL